MGQLWRDRKNSKEFLKPHSSSLGVERSKTGLIALWESKPMAHSLPITAIVNFHDRNKNMKGSTPSLESSSYCSNALLMALTAIIHNTVISKAAVSTYTALCVSVIKVIFYCACDMLRGCMPNAWSGHIPHFLLRSNHFFPSFPGDRMPEKKSQSWSETGTMKKGK